MRTLLHLEYVYHCWHVEQDLHDVHVFHTYRFCTLRPPPPGLILFFNPLSFYYFFFFSPCISPTYFPWQSSWRNSINCAIFDSKHFIHWLAPLCIHIVVDGSCGETIMCLKNLLASYSRERWETYGEQTQVRSLQKPVQPINSCKRLYRKTIPKFPVVKGFDRCDYGSTGPQWSVTCCCVQRSEALSHIVR